MQNNEEKSCKNCGYNTSADNYIVMCHDASNICANHSRWFPRRPRAEDGKTINEIRREAGMDAIIKDSGNRTQFQTGAVRDMHQGKGRCDLLPPNALLRLARHFETGSLKYGDRNWELGIPCHSFADSGMRHLLKFMAGDTDEDHLIAAIWNLMCLAETEQLRPEMMDIPSRDRKGSEPENGSYVALDLLQQLKDQKFCDELSQLKEKDEILEFYKRAETRKEFYKNKGEDYDGEKQ